MDDLWEDSDIEHTVLQSKKAITAYLKSNQIRHSGCALTTEPAQSENKTIQMLLIYAQFAEC